MGAVVIQEIRVKKGAIHCPGCEATIERFLALTPGIQTVDADEKAQTVTVGWDPEVTS